jgi:hypothetical protein
MPDFAILSEKGGIAQNLPTVLLPEVFLAKESRNVHERYGRYDRVRGRLPELCDSESVQIKTPTDVYTIVSVTSGTKTIVVDGDVLSGATVLADGDTIRLSGSSTTANNITFTVNGTPVYAAGPDESTIIVDETITTQAVSGNLFVGATPVLRYHKHVRHSDGTEHLLLGTKYHLFLWVNSTLSLDVKWTCVSPSAVTRWEIVDHLRNVVATNNSDFVLWWDVNGGTSNDFVALDNANGIDYEGTANRLTKCKHIISYEGYLVLGYTTEAGASYPQRQRWASLRTDGGTVDFDENGAGDAGAKEFDSTPGFLMGFARHADDLVIAKEDSMHRSWVVTEDTVFNWEEYTLKVGNVSADGMVNDKAGRLYWLATDLTIREINTPTPISIAVDTTLKTLNTAQAEYIQSTYIDEYEQIWWAVPSVSSDTNDLVIAFHPDSGRSFIHEFPIRAFGDYTQQSVYTYDSLPFDTYEAWGAEWLIYDARNNVVGFPLDICSDYLGNTFDLHRADKDNGNDFTGTMIFSTTLSRPKVLNFYKRINNGMDVVINRKSTGTVNIYVKRDTEKSWSSIGSISLIDTDEPDTLIVHKPFDKRARTFLIKLESTAYAELIGLIFRDFEIDDSR